MSPGVRISWSEMCTWNERDAGDRAGGRPDLGRIVGLRGEVVAERRADVGEAVAGELHPVAGVAGEPDDDVVELLGLERSWCRSSLAPRSVSLWRGRWAVRPVPSAHHRVATPRDRDRAPAHARRRVGSDVSSALEARPARRGRARSALARRRRSPPRPTSGRDDLDPRRGRRRRPGRSAAATARRRRADRRRRPRRARPAASRTATGTDVACASGPGTRTERVSEALPRRQGRARSGGPEATPRRTTRLTPVTGRRRSVCGHDADHLPGADAPPWARRRGRGKRRGKRGARSSVPDPTRGGVTAYRSADGATAGLDVGEVADRARGSGRTGPGPGRCCPLRSSRSASAYQRRRWLRARASSPRRPCGRAARSPPGGGRGRRAIRRRRSGPRSRARRSGDAAASSSQSSSTRRQRFWARQQSISTGCCSTESVSSTNASSSVAAAR